MFIEMLKVLMHRRRKPLMLILDSLPAHKGKAVRSYVERPMENWNALLPVMHPN